MDPFWERTAGPVLAQGDLLTDCLVPLFAPGFGTEEGAAEVLVAQDNRLMILHARGAAVGDLTVSLI